MTTRSTYTRCFEARRTGSHHNDVLGALTAFADDMRQSGLAPGRRIMRTQGLAFTVNPVYTVTHADTRADLILFAAHDLGNDMWVRNVGPGHADKIEQTFFDGVACGCDIIDPGGMHDRQIKMTLHFCGELKMRCLRSAHVGDQTGKPDAGRTVTPVDVKEINHAGAGKQFTDLEALVKLKTAIEGFIKHHPDAHDVVIAYLSPYFLQDLD